MCQSVIKLSAGELNFIVFTLSRITEDCCIHKNLSRTMKKFKVAVAFKRTLRIVRIVID